MVVTDDAGRRVTVPASPSRIISLSPGHTETLYALGLGNRVVATDTYSDYPPEVRPKATLNCWPRAPVEAIVAARPDLVFVMVLTQSDEFLRQMDAVRVPALELFPHTYAGTETEILLMGRVTGTGRVADRLVDEMRIRAERVQERVRRAPRPRVYFEIDGSDPARPWVAGRGAFYQDLIGMAGGRNVFDDLPGAAAQVSLEQVIARDPEVILLGGGALHPERAGALKRRPGWGSIAAVRTGRVYTVNGERMTRASPRLADGLEEMARCLHPERER